VDHAADFGQDREGVRIPFEQDLVGLDRRAVFHQDARAVNHLIAFLLAALVVDHGDDAVAVHGDHFALLVAHGLDADVLGESRRLGVLLGLLAAGGRAADVERTHGELRAGLADGLRRDDADRFAALHQAAGGQVAAVAG
jgi:hypothetical protein